VSVIIENIMHKNIILRVLTNEFKVEKFDNIQNYTQKYVSVLVGVKKNPYTKPTFFRAVF